MAIRYRRRIRLGKHAWVNVSRSGISTSVKAGPVTLNSRGTESVHLAKGLTYQARVGKGKAAPAVGAEVKTPAQQQMPERQFTPRVVSRGTKRLVTSLGITCAVIGFLMLVAGAGPLGIFEIVLGGVVAYVGSRYEVKPKD